MHVAAALSLAVCITTAVAWARGGWTQRELHRIVGRWEYLTDGGSYGGRVQLVLVHDWATPVVGPKGSGPTIDAWLARSPDLHLESGRFELHWWPEIGGLEGGHWTLIGRRLDVVAPFSGVVLASLVLPATLWGFLPVRRLGLRTAGRGQPAAADACDRCGYDLRAHRIGDRCPECGCPIGRPDAGRLRRTALADGLLGLSRVFLGVTFAAVFQRNGGFVAAYEPAAAAATAAVVTHAVGIVLLTAGVRTGRRARQFALAAAACLAAGVGYQVTGTLTAAKPFGLMGSPSIEWYGPTVALLAVGWVLYAAAVMAEFLFLARLAGRLGDPVLARSSLAAGGVATTTAAALPFAMPAAVAQWTDLGPFRVVIVAWFAGLVWAGLVHLDFAVRFAAAGRRPATVGDAADRPAIG